MAVRIRLARHGKKKAPFYRLVVADSRSPRDGRVDEERALHWLSVGALPSDTARALLRKAGVLDKFAAAKQTCCACEIPEEE